MSQNKVLPGTYINFVSAARSTSSLSARGVAAMPLELDWGVEGEVLTVTSEQFYKDSRKIFGYDYSAAEMKGLRDLFRNIQTGYFYKLNQGVKAANTFCTAKYGGSRGNDLKTVIQKNVDDSDNFDVQTLLGDVIVDSQTVGSAAELQDNDFVTWKAEATLAATASTPLTGGTNGEAVTGTEYKNFLDKIESYSFNAVGCLATEKTTCDLFTAWTKRLRDEVGMKFQTVLYRTAADYEGIVSLDNTVTGDKATSLIYWVTGIIAGCAVNKSNTNLIYDGEFAVDTNYTQSQLESGIQSGKFMLHKVGDSVRVLEDINSLVTYTDEKGKDFASNQTVRVLDQIGNDIAALFNNKYLGNVPNDDAGRISLWNDIVSHHRQLESIRAIENFEADDVTVSAGETKKSVVVSDAVTPISAMTQLYMTVVVE